LILTPIVVVLNLSFSLLLLTTYWQNAQIASKQDSNQSQAQQQQPMQQSHIGRQMYRFGQSDGTSPYVSNTNTNNSTANPNTGSNTLNPLGSANSSSRSNIKRSVSQVPTTDRRPMTTGQPSSTPVTTASTATPAGAGDSRPPADLIV
jgi:type II secretory pathway pseudopilin PulG